MATKSQPGDSHPSALTRDPETLLRYSRDTVYQGRADYAFEAGDWKTAAEILEYCSAVGLPVTFCGSQTSMNGASVPDGGVVVATGRRDRVLDIAKTPGGGTVMTEPGVILAELKRAVAAEGLYYPPEPTSYEEARVGATVATNATGEDSFKYGPTRPYVEELEILTAEGKSRTLKRTRPPPDLPCKNLAGYCLEGEDIDAVIGSEGTLALITKLKLRLLPEPGRGVFLIILPFDNFANCLKAVVRLAAGSPRPRALELIGPGAAEYFRAFPACPKELKDAGIFLYVKDEYDDDFEAKLALWFERLATLYAELNETDSLERVFVARTDAQLRAIHACRHHVPLAVNEEYFGYAVSGGGKVGTDWWVPLPRLEKMMTETYDGATALGIPFLVFAHIGNGHPHWNFLTRTAEERAKAEAFVKEQCRKAAAAGGGVAGEHGIGKTKRELIAVQHAPDIVRRMTALKERWDPKWILGRGNILARPGSY